MRLNSRELKLLMERRNIKPRDLAKYSEISPSAISEILSEQVVVRERRMKKIIHGLRRMGCSKDLLTSLVIYEQPLLFPEFEHPASTTSIDQFGTPELREKGQA